MADFASGDGVRRRRFNNSGGKANLVGSARTGEQTDALKVRDPVQEIEVPFTGFLGGEVLPRIPGHVPQARAERPEDPEDDHPQIEPHDGAEDVRQIRAVNGDIERLREYCLRIDSVAQAS